MSGGTKGVRGGKTIHGMRHTSEYNTWVNIRSRCYNPNNNRYSHYGKRGITVCDRWKDSFVNFYADMGAKPSPKHSIERINNEGGYTPENCKWGTQVEQANNKRSNRTLTIGGETRQLRAWSKHFDIPLVTVYRRIKRGMSEIEALTTKGLRRI